MNALLRSAACIFSTATLSLVVSSASLAAAENTLPADARAALDKAAHALRAISTEGGYLWRYSPDLKIRGGENPATATQVWVQPPGTPAVGQAFLRAYEATHDAFFLSAARDAALCLVLGQLESGGWDYKIEFDPAKRAEWRYRDRSTDSRPASKNAHPVNTSTYDDNNTQSALRFLLAFLDVAKSAPDPRDARIQDTLDYGLTKILESQYSNGAWPQRWDGHPHDPAKFPIKQASIPTDYPREQPNGSYYGHYTFNDNAHRDLVVTLIDAWHRTGNILYRDAARRAADYLLLAQLPEPQPIWAQQYDENMYPAWARAFEPPSVTAGETAGIIRLLVDLYLEFDDEKYIHTLPPAIAWLRSHELSPGKWARMYELSTSRPIYGDRDKKIHYTLAEISEERRRGYGWQGGFGVTEAIKYYEDVTASGRDAWLANHAAPFAISTPASPLARSSLKKSETEIRSLITTLNADGFWLTKRSAKLIDPTQTEWIETEVFIRNCDLLCSYLKFSKP